MNDKRTQRHSMNRWQKAAALVVVVLALGGTGTLLYEHYGHSAPHPLSTTPTCLQRMRSGSFCTGIALKEITKTDLAAFTSTTGVFPSVVEYYQRFGVAFSRDSAVQIASLGARPFIQLNPHNVSIGAIAGGRYDAYLEKYATAVKQFGHPVVLSFGHEMNGDWSTWSLPFTKPATFVAAWRHIVHIFRAYHVKNVVWAWDVSHIRPARHKSYQSWYPGNGYVDWIGIDGYLRPGQTFAGQFWRVITAVRKFAGTKPVLITETAVAPGKDQVAQIHELFSGARERHLVGLIWFDVNKKKDWQLGHGNTAALAAFRKEAQ